MAWPSPSITGWSSSARMSRDLAIAFPLWIGIRQGYRPRDVTGIGQLSQRDISCRRSAAAGACRVGVNAVDQLVLVSSDCHGGAPWEGYKPYLGSELHEQFDAWLETKYAGEAEAKSWRNAFFSDEYQERFNATAAARGRPSDMGWEVPVDSDEVRIEQLEGDGVVAEIVFPDGNRDEPPWRGFMDIQRYSPELRFEGARAWNRWMADLVAVRPNQHIGGGLVDLA